MSRPAPRACLALSVAVFLAAASPSLSQEMPPPEEFLRMADPALRAELHPRKPNVLTTSATTETLWIGHTPGYQGPTNPWSIHVGTPRPPAQGGMWDFETPVGGDSLQGWWPVRARYTSAGGLTLDDWRRPWWALDYGNQANYVVNQGRDHPRTFGVVGV